MKFNKEMLLKHKFWLLLVLSLPLTLGSLFLLVTAVSGDISRTRATLEAEQKKIKPSVPIRTPADIALVRREADIEKAKEKVVHAQAYALQDALFTWPQLIEERYNFRSGLFAQQIKIRRGAAAAGEMPKDEERLLHGVVIDRRESFIEVEGKDKRKHKFFMSMNVYAKNAVEGDDKLKEVNFAGIRIGDHVAVAFHKGKYFGETLTDRELGDYIMPDVYLSQIDSLLTQVQPMNAKGEGVVQLRMTNTNNNWYYKKGELPPSRDEQRFLIFLDKGWEQAEGEISEETWLAQEDLWIQREIYRLIRLANDYVSKFKGSGGEDKNKVYTFTNPFWELGLTWSGGAKLNLTIKNQKERRQKLDDVSFRISFSKTMAPETIAVGGLPLGPHETRPLVIDLKGDNPSRKGIYGVEQVLTWETAAVKRFDAISIGSLRADEIAMSCRTYSDGQRSLKNDEFKQGAIVGQTKKKGGFNDRDDMRGRGRGGKRQAVIVDAANQITKHNLIRNRYVEVTPQVSRRVPVGVSLIVDQDHIDSVVTAFNNSKLRFLNTQISLNRFPGSLRPQLPVDPTAAGAAGAFIQRFPDRPLRSGDANQPGGGGGSDDLETNVEMNIYGIVTLYERSPPPLFPPTAPGAPLAPLPK